MSLDENLTNKQPGDPIRSKDWNALASETVRLDAATKLNSQAIGFQMLKAKEWSNVSTSGEWTPVIRDEGVNFDTPTSLLLIGQGHASSDTQGIALRVAFRVDNTVLGLGPESSTDPWGAVYLNPGTTPNSWVPITAIAGCPVPKGKRKVELVMRREGPAGTSGTVKFNAPTLWLIRLGAS
ncbi:MULTISPECIES: hypothetical protein [Streptomyces]|jgi:hypothetical protein|uniref:Uncharacterized protein n=1 Tax=Streptomyces ossamyceticus TaxID=249581 RepID=A0ABV2UZ97_9ACTN